MLFFKRKKDSAFDIFEINYGYKSPWNLQITKQLNEMYILSIDLKESIKRCKMKFNL